MNFIIIYLKIATNFFQMNILTRLEHISEYKRYNSVIWKDRTTHQIILNLIKVLIVILS